MTYNNWNKVENEERLKQAVANNTSIAGVCRDLGIVDRGGNIHTIRFHITRLALDTSHHTGQAWKKENFITPNQTSGKAVIKKHMIRNNGHRCEQCGLSEWQGSPIPLELDHIDGNPSNNDPNNLRILCSNCHAQTPTFRNKRRS
jgi:hypothetical protein